MKRPFALLGLGLFSLAACSAEIPLENISYQKSADAPAERHQLDLYPSTQKIEGGNPVVVWIHGGAWKFGNKKHSTAKKAQALNAAGYHLVAVNYRFVPAVGYQDQAEDIAQAILWVQKNIANHGGDPNRLALMGHSAGAHLAALTALDTSYLKEAGVKPDVVQAVILLDGAGYDIPNHLSSAGPRAKKLYLDVFGLDEATQKKASPISHITKRADLPAFLIIPIASREASINQSRRLASALTKAEGTASVFVAPGKTHASVNREWGDQDDQPTETSLSFLNKHLIK